jgi:hypothetical protein
MENTPRSQALFHSVGRDGVDWLFVVGCDGGWAILRNGNEVGLGTGKQPSVDAGVQKFRAMTRVIVSSEAACDPAVAPPLDRIERRAAATATLAEVPADEERAATNSRVTFRG